jgi:hypothetical protein
MDDPTPPTGGGSLVGLVGTGGGDTGPPSFVGPPCNPGVGQRVVVTTGVGNGVPPGEGTTGWITIAQLNPLIGGVVLHAATGPPLRPGPHNGNDSPFLGWAGVAMLDR